MNLVNVKILTKVLEIGNFLGSHPLIILIIQKHPFVMKIKLE